MILLEHIRRVQTAKFADVLENILYAMFFRSLKDSAEHKVAVLDHHLLFERRICDVRTIYAHPTVHTESVCNSKWEKARFDGKGQGKLGHNWVL